MPWRDAEPAEHLIAEMDKVGVDAAVLVHCATIYDFDNRYAIDAAARYPHRFGLVGRFNPESPTLAADIAAFATCTGALGVRALGTQQYAEKFKAGLFDSTFKAARAHDLVVCMYAPELIGEIHRIAKAYPDLQIVLDHMCLDQNAPAAGTDPWALVSDVVALAQYPNVAAKLSGLPSLSKEPYPFKDAWPAVRAFIDAFGPARLMWGTDTTRTPTAYKHELSFLHELDALSQDETALVFGGTLQRIFRWSPSSAPAPA
jgi:predicted TIM-barrel fold metal-dependent hydrolase